jgi:hypothetical protein
MNAWAQAYQTCLAELVTVTVGREFGLWVILGPLVDRSWWCRCACGTERFVLVYNLLSGASESCGCVWETPGKKEHPAEHGVWGGMVERCTPISKDHTRYYDRGIRVCDKWLGKTGFMKFYEDMGSRPSPLHQIDRKDNDLGYSKDNCRWVTVRENAQNKRTNVVVEFRGERKVIAEWARQMGMSRQALRYRLRCGWSVERALTVPMDHGNRYLTDKEKT